MVSLLTILPKIANEYGIYFNDYYLKSRIR